MDFDSNVPIYLQIVNVIKSRIISGELKCGEKIKSVRDLAQEMGVNPNTMQKAPSALEQEKLLYTERTSGKYVTNDKEVISKLKSDMIYQMANDFFKALEKLGISKKEGLEIITEFLGEMSE